jgi:multidrug resistance efflux pump
MAKRIFLPSEILELGLTVEQFAVQRNSVSVVYSAALFLLLFLSFLTPFLYIDVSVKSPGILKATTEVSTLKATSAGYINEVHIKENQVVEKGGVLFTVVAPVLQEREKFFVARLEETAGFKRDLNQLLKVRTDGQSPSITTDLYRQAFVDYQQQLTDRRVRLNKTTQDYERNKRLFDQKVIAPAEFENFQFEYNKATAELDVLIQTQLSQWHQELRSLQKERVDLENQLAQVRKEMENLHIKAPVNGTVQNLVGVYPGSTVFAGQELALISPDTELLAEVYVSPNDIGLLRKGMAVRMQVGAFNYNQWGLLHGKVKEISNDIQIMDNRPVFEVKCSLEKDHLTLKNGYQGKLKKGMTLQARFVVTQRSLWQLLYDKADDWLNPNNEPGRTAPAQAP